MFYKIRSLFESGAEIYLHVFCKQPEKDPFYQKYCKEVHFYLRNSSLIAALDLLPYIVKSRKSDLLISNLKRIKAPILCEGLHSSLILRNKEFSDRKILVRAHNIEHLYYKQLAKNETNMLKKVHFHIEALKLKNYEKRLHECHKILSIASHETDYFIKKHKDKTIYIPAFQPNKRIFELSKKGYFAMFHGNLAVTDNLKAALFLIDVFKSIDYPLVIVGQSSDKKLLSKIDQYKNVSFIPLHDQKELSELFHRAHINVLYTQNSSGVKLKLINALFQSRHVIANDKMVDGSGLHDLCNIANNKAEITNKVLQLISRDFSEKDMALRKERLCLYDNKTNAEKILDQLL